MRPVRVLVADDSDVFRGAVCDVISATPGFAVVAEASSGAAAIELAARTRPDLALIDVRMPGLDGLEAAAKIVADNPGAAVVMITADSESRPIDHVPFAIVDKRSFSPQVLTELWHGSVSGRVRGASSPLGG